MIDLHTSDPGLRVDDSTPFELLDAAEQLPVWDEHPLAVADYLLNAWCVRACMNEDPEGTSALSTTLRALLERLPNSPMLPEKTRHRWQAYLDLLSARALRFTSEREIETLLTRQHVEDLLRALPADGAYKAQGELNANGKFGNSRLSQLLGQIADHGLIDQRKQGKCKDWRLTERGQTIAARLNPPRCPSPPVTQNDWKKSPSHLLAA